ncbi:MAG TPA: clostripain-related cysteine peptidase, partial [Blastocatellia bacterium]|nr:clostripain-related cysteine peptidase [Blastocatellia bacterium]
MRVPFLLRVCLFALALQAVGSAQVLINEVLYRLDPSSSDPLRANQWVELVNKGTNPVDLTGWIVSGRDGSGGGSARTLPSATIPSGGYLVVHFTNGTDRLDFGDGTGDTYSQDVGPVWSTDMDEVALYSPNGIVDFIAWGDVAVPYSPGTAHGDAVAAGIWTPNIALASDGIQVKPFEKPRAVEVGTSIGRDQDSTDTNSPADFEPHGGAAALDNSPNRQNLDQLPIVAVDPAAAGAGRNVQPLAASSKKWTVMLYFDGANSLQTYIFRNMFEISTLGGSDANVNFVVMYKGKRFMGGAAIRGRLLAVDTSNKVDLERAPNDDDINVGQQDMGNPLVLQGFINWAKTNYPADHYALILSAHGDGWKGYGPDETVPGARENGDWLYMGELSTALAGQHFDLIGFDACLMAGIDVADQLRDFTDYFLASEEVIAGRGYPYNTFSVALKSNPGMTGLDLGSKIVQLYAARYQGKADWTLSLTDEKRLSSLISQVDGWSELLRFGAGLFQTRDNPVDNVQVLIKFERAASQMFADPNYVDLYDLAQHINNDGAIPDCVKTPIPTILNLISNTVVVAEQHSSDLKAHGLHIYFPRMRKRMPRNYSDDDYDYPDTRQSDGNSRLAIYAQNHDQLPLMAIDQEDSGALNPRTQWPEPPSPQVRFVQDTRWPLFLERYYHPVADNHIVKGVAPDGEVILPDAVAGGACANPIDEITVPVGSTVFFSGAGSSDADQPDFQPVPAVPAMPFIFPNYYWWDQDASVQECPADCLAPMQVPPGSDAGAMSNNNMDADRDIADTTWDEKNGSGPAFSRTCDSVRQYIVTLTPWDNNHLMPFHDTNPDAPYVHPQTDSQGALINCTALPTTFLIDQPPTYTLVGETLIL